MNEASPRASNFGCASVLLVLGACFAAAMLGGASGLLVRKSVLVLSVPLAASVLILWPPRRSVRAKTWLARALLAPFIALSSAWVIAHPVVHRELCLICPSGDNPGVMAFPMSLAIIVLGASLIARAIATRMTASERAARGALVVAAIAIVLSLIAFARKPSLTIKQWVGSLPEVGTFSVNDGNWRDLGDGGSEQVIGDVHLRRNAKVATVSAAVGVVPAPGETSWLGVGHGSVRVDRTRRLIVLEQPSAPDARTNVVGAGRVVFTFEGKHVALSARDLHGVVAPPLSWIVLSVGASLLALVRLRTRKREATLGEPYRSVPDEGLDDARAAALATAALGAAPLVAACIVGLAP